MIVKLLIDWSGAKAFTDITVSKRTAIYLKSIGAIDHSTVIEEKKTQTIESIIEKKSPKSKLKPKKNTHTQTLAVHKENSK